MYYSLFVNQFVHRFQSSGFKIERHQVELIFSDLNNVHVFEADKFWIIICWSWSLSSILLFCRNQFCSNAISKWFSIYDMWKNPEDITQDITHSITDGYDENSYFWHFNWSSEWSKRIWSFFFSISHPSSFLPSCSFSTCNLNFLFRWIDENSSMLDVEWIDTITENEMFTLMQ